MAAEQMRPASKQEAPDPSNAYERAHPEREAGMGRLDNNKAVPTDRPDQIDDAVGNKQDPERQLNAHELTGDRSTGQVQPPRPQPDHSMHDEDPTDADAMPTDIHDPARKRHPRVGGKGGTPDEGEPRRNG